MRLGLCHAADSERNDAQYLLGRLDEWIVTAGAAPAAVSVRAVNLSVELLQGLHERGIEPVVWLTSAHVAPTAFALRRIVNILASSGDLVIRWDHEVNGFERAPWYRMDPDLYRRNWRRVRDLMPDNVRMAYIPMLLQRNQIDDFETWYPGDDVVDIVGFDTYARGERLTLPSVRWSHPVAWWQRHHPGKPIYVTEFGITHRGTNRRRRMAWLRDLRNVEGVDVAMYFDKDKPDEGPHARWRLDWQERRLMGRLMR